MSDTGPQFTLEQDGVFTRVNMEYTNDALDAMAQRAAERIEDELAQQLLARLGYVKPVRCRECDLSQKDGTRCLLFAGWEPIEGGDEYELVSAEVEPDGYCAWCVRKEVAE